MDNALHYPGEELELFREARNWKRYFASRLRPFIQGSVLEVGAGLGENQAHLLNAAVSKWTALEPDPGLFKKLTERIQSEATLPMQARAGTIDTIASERFDTILYIDVLEHIEADREELKKAASLLRAGGRLIVLSPAYPWLFSPFDKAIGHFRRYTTRSLRAAAADTGLQAEQVFHLESAGCALLLVNKGLARKSYPTPATVRFWDRLVVPVSKALDWLTGYRFGKTIIGIWKKGA